MTYHARRATMGDVFSQVTLNLAVSSIVYIAGALVAIGTIGRAILLVYRWGMRAEKAWTYVQDELKPNSGHSTRDVINELKDWTERTESLAIETNKGLADWACRTDERFARVEDRLTSVEELMKKPVQVVQPVTDPALIVIPKDD